jgi:O-antigen/teichoic acid export membrane protein
MSMITAIRSQLSPVKLVKFRKRAGTVIANSVNSLLLPVFNIAISYLVIRFASVDLWGEFVQWLIIVQLGAHIVSWGNKEYLLRAFSFNPSQIAQAWQTSLISRSGLFVLLCGMLVFVGTSLPQRLLLTFWSLGLVLFQSYDVLIVYKKDFLFAALVESLTLTALALTIIGLGTEITLEWLIFLFGLVYLFKAGIYLLRYHPLTTPQVISPVSLAHRFEFKYFKLAFPFFLLGFSGMLQSRIDLYAVNIFLSKSEVGQYQVFINLMIYLQSVSAFILIPFVKSIYRLGYRSIQKMSVRLFGLGLLMLAPALWLIHLMLTYIYQFSLSPHFLLAGGLFVLPIYFYLPIIYALYKTDRETVVLKINIIGTALNFGLNLLLLPRVGMIGAVIASAISQWAMLVAYLMQNKGEGNAT